MELIICSTMFVLSVVIFMFSYIQNRRNYKKMDSLWQINARTLQKLNMIIDKTDNEYQE